MKAISIKQPWAWLIVNGLKDIENRDWITWERGHVLIHAGKQFDNEGYAWIAEHMQSVFEQMPEPNQYDMGGVVGECEIVDCVVESTSPWFFGPFGFVIRDAKPLPFMPCRGRLGFFEVEYPSGS
jgi:hypothetical protein